MKLFFFSLLLFTYLINATASSEQLLDLKEKNIADFFRNSAQEILQDLEKNSSTELLESGKINIEHLEKTLNNSTISVVFYDLIDNTGSIVDAIGTPNKVILDGRIWQKFMKSPKNISLLVLHELLRMSGINDDDYKYSLSLMSSTHTESTLPTYCNLRVQSTQISFKKKSFKGTGFGTPMNMIFITPNNPNTKEAYENATKEIKEKCDKSDYPIGPTNLDGQIIIENQNQNGVRTNVFKASLTGVCFRQLVKERSEIEQRSEACQKVQLCEKVTNSNSEGSFELYSIMNQLNTKWKCQ